MRELRHPCTLLHAQDRESRQRNTKPPRQYGLSGATSLLSLGYLFYQTQLLLKEHVGSLSPAFTSAFLAFRKTVRQTFVNIYEKDPNYLPANCEPNKPSREGCYIFQKTVCGGDPDEIAKKEFKEQIDELEDFIG